MKQLKQKLALILGLTFAGVTSWSQAEVFNYTGSLQYYTVPAGVSMITVTAEGAQGGNDGGLGAIMKGDIAVTAGEEITILVGQQGDISGGIRAGGGGGSFVVNEAGEPLVIAGGGGGRAWGGTGTPTFPGIDANITEDGNNGYSEENGLSSSTYTLRHGIGGTGGNGATLTGPHGDPHAGNGGGFLTSGSDGSCGGGGQSFLLGGAGGTGCSGGPGGYGGGGNGGNSGGGGGGGYSGGGGSYHNPTNGGGGGSFNAGINQDNSVGRTGNGLVTIEITCDGLTTSVSDLTLCSADMLTLTATSANGGTVVWDNDAPNGEPFQPNLTGLVTYTATSDHPDDCAFQVEILLEESPEYELTTTDELLGGDGGIDLTLISGLFPFSYDWDNDGTGDFDDTQNLPTAPAGTYSVSVMHANGCVRTRTATINSQLSIGEEAQNEMNLFPNPAKDRVNLVFPGYFNYQIVNSVGEVVAVGDGTDQTEVDLAPLANGTYVVRILTEKATTTQQLIKQ